MTKTYRSPICVGGPLDGRRVDGPPGKTTFEVAERVPLPDLTDGLVRYGDMAGPTPVMARHVYRMRDIHFEGGTVQFWAPDRQPMNDTIALLLKVYEEAAIAARGIITPKRVGT